MTQHVPEIAASNLSAAYFQEKHARPGLPLVIRNLFDPESLFSFSAFCEEMQGRKVQVFEFGRNRPEKWRWKGFAKQYELPIRAYLRMLENGTARARDIYLHQMPVNDLASTAEAAKFLESLGTRLALKRLYPWMDGYLWVGPEGHVEPLHNDEGDGTLLQIAGRKRAVLFPARQLDNLYPFPLFAPVAPWVSQVDLSKPDFTRFPKLKTALDHRQETIIGPGDLLYLPTQWSHEISTLEDPVIISISRLWKVSPWKRNFCTRRAALWYLKRQVPQKAVVGAYDRLTSLRARFKAKS